ncbi:thioredoxin family protein [Gracilimonas mengyeensis]|uniref:Peroxiredoxin n=1 Tax=Gracilimonas mengyeensis TaxID=1302730 RepID=A0A521BDC9_9BACT|nr:thioredoxin family protein [Gracilimonas mengyeensis]SMO45069.1 Peroxiredoxin [Gracilimonas mengyeensis]
MSATPSTMLELGTQAPDFKLPSVNGGELSLNYASQSKGFVVMFICNHCPYVLHIEDELVNVANEYIAKGIGFIAISSNDVENYPEDSPEKMAQKNYPFPYLFDESQEVAKDYNAACTPDIFVFNKDRELVYRGQFDDSRPKNDKPVTGKDLRTALDAVLEGKTIPEEKQIPSIGCNIKWKPGNEPDYFG